MAGGDLPGARELDQTPTWAVAGVCAVIVLISILLEMTLHHVGHWFDRRRKKALVEALEKVKAELMVLGFISLLLTFGQKYITRICIPEKLADTMLFCAKDYDKVHKHHGPDSGQLTVEKGKGGGAEHHRRLLWHERRFLAGGGGKEKGCGEGYLPMISVNGLHQLHIFIFFLAVFHVLYSAITMTLGRLKIRGWKVWERDAVKDHDEVSRFRLTHEDSFVKDHTSAWASNKISFFILCFFRQFFRSVRRADFLTMRHGFISVHLAPGSKFNFQKYILRSLEDDFKVVVGITPLLFISVKGLKRKQTAASRTCCTART